MPPSFRVPSRNAEAFSRRFDGELFSFPPGERVSVPEDAAAYIFAYGQNDAARARVLIRNGWQRNGALDLPAALERLHKFVFNQAPPAAAPAKPQKKVLASMKAKAAIDAEIVDVGNPITPNPGEGSPGEPPSQGLMLETNPTEQQIEETDTQPGSGDAVSAKPPTRTPTGIAAMSPGVDPGGHTRVPRGTISLPGRSAPIAPHSGPA